MVNFYIPILRIKINLRQLFDMFDALKMLDVTVTGTDSQHNGEWDPANVIIYHFAYS